MRYASTKLGKWFLLPYVVILLAVIAFLGGSYWVWQQYEFSRAFRELKAGEIESVIPRTERLIAIGPDPDRARVIQVRALIEIDLAGAREELDLLMDKDGAREHPEVVLAYLRLRLETKDLEGIDEYLDKWHSSLADNPEFLFLQAKIRLEQGKTVEAFSSLEQLISLDPTDEDALLLRGQLLLQSNNRAQAVQAKANLRTASKGSGNTGYEALVTLASHPAIPLFDNDREWLMERLRQNRKKTPLSRLLADSQQMILEPKNRDIIIAKAINRESARDPELLAQWLMANGAYEQLKTFMQSEAASELGDGRWGAELRANLMTGDFDNAIRMLDQSNLPVNKVRRATLMAFIEQEQLPAPTAAPTEKWLSAYDMAIEAQAAPEIFALGQLAMRLNWQDAATRAFQTAIDLADNDRDKIIWIPYYLGMLITRGETAKSLALIQRFLEINPEDMGMLNNQYYLEALLDVAPNADPNRIAPLVARAPNSILVSTYSFLLWKAGQNDAAYEMFRNLDRKFYVIASCRLGGGLIMIDRSDFAAAEKLLREIDADKLLPEELVLYEQAQAQIALHQQEL